MLRTVAVLKRDVVVAAQVYSQLPLFVEVVVNDVWCARTNRSAMNSVLFVYSSKKNNIMKKKYEQRRTNDDIMHPTPDCMYMIFLASVRSAHDLLGFGSVPK